MKGTYRIWVQRVTAPHDWELVGSCADADEAWASALRWEQMNTTTAVRVDLCVRYWHLDEASQDRKTDA